MRLDGWDLGVLAAYALALLEAHGSLLFVPITNDELYHAQCAMLFLKAWDVLAATLGGWLWARLQPPCHLGD